MRHWLVRLLKPGSYGRLVRRLLRLPPVLLPRLALLPPTWLYLSTGSRLRTVADAPSEPVAVVFGHEVLGILPQTQTRCDTLVRIPVAGHKNSINVATAFGIVAYDILRTWEQNS